MEAGKVEEKSSSGSAAEEKPREEAPGSPVKEPFVGNVSRFTPLPADTDAEGPAKKGFLQFDACFEGGDEWLLLATN